MRISEVMGKKNKTKQKNPRVLLTGFIQVIFSSFLKICVLNIYCYNKDVRATNSFIYYKIVLLKMNA